MQWLEPVSVAAVFMSCPEVPLVSFQAKVKDALPALAFGFSTGLSCY